MRIHARTTAALLLPVMLGAAPAYAQQARLANPVVLQRALQQHAALEAGQRARIDALLARAEVAQLASRLGLDLSDARAAVPGLAGEQLATAAARAQALDVALAGGQTTVVISLTTLLLVLLIVVLLAD